jgi:hypothetical protein
MVRKVYSVLPVLLVVVFLSCGPGSGATRSTPQVAACRLDDEFARMAKAVADGLPAGTKVVVLNFSPFRSQDVSQLGVYLAKRFGTILARQGQGRITVIDRPLGSNAFLEEMNYTVDRPDPREVLKRFEAGCAVVATYDLRDNDRTLQLVELKALPTSGADVRVAVDCRANDDYETWRDFSQELLPNMSETLRGFFVENGELAALGAPRMFRKDGPEIPANGSVRVGETHKFSVLVKQPCYVYVLGWDQTNRIVTVLFPEPNQPANVGVGSFTFPTGRNYAVAKPPAGSNVVKVIATTADIGLTATGELMVKDPAVQDKLVRKILDLGSRNWGSVTFPFQIVE